MKSKRGFVKENEIETSQGKDTFAGLATQCSTEYQLAWKHQKPKKDEAEVRLKLYNNQRRDKSAVGDTTLFSIQQTVVAALYMDRLNVDFGGREEGDEESADNLTAMAKFDYTEMEKDELDYDWIWDTAFFGRGYVDMSEWERDPEKKIYLPLPYVVDPIPFLRDPLATSVNGDRKHRGSARFYGYEMKMTEKDLSDSPHMFSDIDFKAIKFGSGTQSLLKDAISARDLAQGRQTTEKQEKESMLGANSQYTITKWNTHWKVGDEVKKVKVWLANDRSKVVGVEILKKEYWPLVDRSLYPTAHDWDGTSIPDLTEDKQRARAVAQNLGLSAMKADIYPMYIYDSKKIVNRKDLKFNFNKFIPADSKGEPLSSALTPLIKSRPNLALLNFIMETLGVSAQKATATPDIQQGIQSEKDRPLGETNLIATKVDTRYSLSARIFGWSEKRFWRQWYQMYKDNFADGIDEKVLRIVGAFGAKWRPLMKKDFVTNIDPDIIIESKVLSRAKQLEERQSLTEYFGFALQEATSNRRWGLKKLGKLNGLEKDEIDRLFPPTIDERIAEDQNDILNEDTPVKVLPEDDHNVHLEIHSKAKETNATKAHIETHKAALSIKKVNPEFFPEEQVATDFQAPGTKPLPKPEESNQASIKPSQTSGQT